MSGVTFGYGPEPIVRDLDLHIPFGERLAIVGPSGVGKSTLTLLLSGLLAPDSGEVRIDGVPVDEIDGAALAGRRALIPQEAYIFDGTLWENLVYLRPDATERQVGNAVRALGFGRLVERVGGYRAAPPPGSLSAGERQLVALARVYLSTARIVILDEATCHLDRTAEARVERAFAKRGGTVVVVAHRISSAQRATRILVMDGTRTTLGTHDTLLIDSPMYRDLVGHWEGGSNDPPAGRPSGRSARNGGGLLDCMTANHRPVANGKTALNGSG